MKVIYQTYIRHLNTYVVTVSTYEGYLPNIRYTFEHIRGNSVYI